MHATQPSWTGYRFSTLWSVAQFKHKYGDLRSMSHVNCLHFLISFEFSSSCSTSVCNKNKGSCMSIEYWYTEMYKLKLLIKGSHGAMLILIIFSSHLQIIGQINEFEKQSELYIYISSFEGGHMMDDLVE